MPVQHFRWDESHGGSSGPFIRSPPSLCHLRSTISHRTPLKYVFPPLQQKLCNIKSVAKDCKVDVMKQGMYAQQMEFYQVNHLCVLLNIYCLLTQLIANARCCPLHCHCLCTVHWSPSIQVCSSMAFSQPTTCFQGQTSAVQQQYQQLLREANKCLAVPLVHNRALVFNPAEHLNWRTPCCLSGGAKGDIAGQLSLVLGYRSHFFWVLRWGCQGLVKLLICLDKMSH